MFKEAQGGQWSSMRKKVEGGESQDLVGLVVYCKPTQI